MRASRRSNRFQAKPRGAKIWVYQVQKKSQFRTGEYESYFFECGSPERAEITRQKYAERFPNHPDMFRVERVLIDWWPGSTRIDVYCPGCGAITGHDQKAGNVYEVEERPSSGKCGDCQESPVTKLLEAALKSGGLVIGDEESSVTYRYREMCPCGRGPKVTGQYCEDCLRQGE